MKNLMIVFVVLNFYGISSWSFHGTADAQKESNKVTKDKDNEIILSGGWQICVNHRVATKAESFAVAGAWCDQHFVRVRYEEPVDLENELDYENGDVAI